MPITKMLVIGLATGFGAYWGWKLGSSWGVLPGFLIANLGFASGWYSSRRFVGEHF